MSETFCPDAFWVSLVSWLSDIKLLWSILSENFTKCDAIHS